MKSLICSLVLVLCSFFLRAQTTTLAYPIKQGIANSPTTEGVTNAMYGKFIIYSYADTTSANADSYIKHQAFSFISTTSPIALWYRDLTNQIWLQLSVSGSPTVSSWLTRGNDLSGQSLPNRLGTKNGDELNIITSDLIRAIIPAGGIVRSSSAQNKYLMQDTVGKELYYGDGGTTHTWQQTLTAGSTLTGNNTVDVDGYTLTFNSANTFQVNATNEIQFLYNGTTTVELDLASDQFGLVSSVGSISSSISMPASSINLFPYNGAFFIDTLLNSTTQNALVGWTTTSGANRGKVGYITLGTGGSISSGVLSFTGTQTWQETLTAGSVLSSDVTATIDPGHVFSLAGSNGDIGFDMTTGGVTPSVHIQSGEIDLTTVVSGETRSEIVIPYDNIAIKPYNGGLLIDTLLNSTTQNSLMGWTTTSGANRGKVGYITLGTGLSLSSGVLSAAASGLTVGTSPIASGTTTRILYDNAGVLGEYTLTGTGTVVAMQTSPSFVTSVIGGASFDAFNTVSTTLNIGGAATTMTIGGTPTTAITHNYSTNATATATTKTINFGTGGAAGSTTNVNVGDADGGTTTVNSPTLAAKIITGTSSANVATFTSTGYAQNTIQVTDPDGSMYITNSQIKALNQPFVLNANASYISLQTAGVERMRVAYDGNVGMGVTPTSQLHTTSFGAGYHFVDNADYTVLATDHVISVTSKGGGSGAGGGSIITLPDAGNCTGRIYVVKFYDNSSTTDITIASVVGNVQDDTGTYAGTFTIGSTGYPATKRIFSCTYQSNGTDWELIATGTRQ